jgi:hypothetical protein
MTAIVFADLTFDSFQIFGESLALVFFFPEFFSGLVEVFSVSGGLKLEFGEKGILLLQVFNQRFEFLSSIFLILLDGSVFPSFLFFAWFLERCFSNHLLIVVFVVVFLFLSIQLRVLNSGFLSLNGGFGFDALSCQN